MNESGKTIDLPAIPGMGSMLVRAALTRKSPSNPPMFPAIRIRARGVTVDRAKLSKFNAVCGFDSDRNVPLPYPHIMAFALHMQLMLDESFPFTPMGAVHVRNRIRQHRPLQCDEAMDFEVRLGDCEQVEKGYEVSLVTEVRVAGNLVWDDVSVMLIRKHGSRIKKDKTTAGTSPTLIDTIQWQLAADKGGSYFEMKDEAGEKPHLRGQLLLNVGPSS